MDKRCVDSRARAQMERGNTRGGATKKREISHTLLSIILHFSILSIRVQQPWASLSQLDSSHVLLDSSQKI